MALNIIDFGGIGDGITSNDVALTKALAAIPATGGRIYFPAGRYKFDGLVSYSLVVAAAEIGRTGLSIAGDGIHATKLYWPNAGGGLSLTQTNANQALSVRDLSFVTGVPNGGAALTLTGTGGYGPTQAQSLISNVSFEGNDGGGPGSQYWAYGVNVAAWSAINFDNLSAFGANKNGIGVRLSGTASNYYGVIYNFTSCNFEYLSKGIFYDSYVQGVTVVGCNFNGGSYGIHSPSTALGTLSQLSVANSQFDSALHQIFTETTIANTQITNCVFFVKDGYSGLHLAGSQYPQVTNSWFNGPGSASGAQGVHVDGSPIVGTITGNIFRSLGIGVVLGGATSGMNVESNAYSACNTPVLNVGTNNKVGIASA